MSESKTRSMHTILIYIGVFLAISVPFFIIYGLFPILQNRGVSDEIIQLLSNLGLWILAGGLILLVLKGENAPIKSLGTWKITGKEIGLAIIIGIGLSLFVPVMNFLVQVILNAFEISVEVSTLDTSDSPYYMALLTFAIITAGTTEEIIYRGYLIGRIDKLIDNKSISAIISICVFTIVHFYGWTVLHVVFIVFPLGVILTLIYLKKRNIIFNMIIHTFVDLPLILLALLS